MSKSCVLYHAGCYDGFSSAWVAHKFLGDDADYVAVSYGNDVPPIDDYDKVYILDFSYDAKTLVEMSGRVDQIVLLDHHKTARANLAALQDEGNDKIEIHFDMDRCGSMMTWEYFFPDESPPALLVYVQDNDLWSHQQPMWEEVKAYLGIRKFDFDEFDAVSKDLSDLVGVGKGSDNRWHITDRIGSTNDLIISDAEMSLYSSKIYYEGSAVLRSNQMYIERAVEEAGLARVGKYDIPCVNSRYLQSEIGNLLAREHPAALVYYIDKDCRMRCSLRSFGGNPDHIDVSELASLYGGGGHKHAAGFSVDMCGINPYISEDSKIHFTVTKKDGWA